MLLEKYVKGRGNGPGWTTKYFHKLESAIKIHRNKEGGGGWAQNLHSNLRGIVL
jgi:hypothetical protein